MTQGLCFFCTHSLTTLLNFVVFYAFSSIDCMSHKKKAVANLDSITHAGCWQCEQEAANKRCGSFGSLCCHGYRAPLVPAMSVQVSALKTGNRSELGLWKDVITLPLPQMMYSQWNEINNRGVLGILVPFSSLVYHCLCAADRRVHLTHFCALKHSSDALSDIHDVG